MYPETENQALKNQAWNPLYDAATILLVQLLDHRRDSFSVSVGVKGYSPAPYVQGTLREGDILLEFSSNVFLEPDMSRLQRSQLDGLGWRKPNGKNPNYSKLILGTNAAETTSRYLVTTLRVVFDVPKNAWFSFGNSTLDLDVASSDNFWHHLDTPSIVCLPEQNHEETIEGIN
jgi:hypothetical protein